MNRYLQLAGFEPLARRQDILADPPVDPADVALLLKTSSTLERQEKGATVRLVEALRAPFVVVSFAVKSLGGREKGMAGPLPAPVPGNGRGPALAGRGIGL